MATVLSTLYPPLVDTFMPAFPNELEAAIDFSISPYNSSYQSQKSHGQFPRGLKQLSL